MPSLSIVVPTYERCDLVGGAIDSAFAWLDRLGEGEVIVVDDASSDGTAEYLEERYRAQLAGGRMKLHRLERNAGVTGAKNAGAALASKQWVVFLDSDDRLIAKVAEQVREELEGCRAPVVFFRCVDLARGELIGERPPEAAEVDLRTLLSDWRWGECLPVVRREAALSYPYPAELRGYEGLAYARMVRAHGPAKVSGVIARRYDEGDHARITNVGRLARWRRHRRYTAIILTEFLGHLSAPMAARYALSYMRAHFDGLRAALVARS